MTYVSVVSVTRIRMEQSKTGLLLCRIRQLTADPCLKGFQMGPAKEQGMARFKWQICATALLAAAVSSPIEADDLADLKARLDAIERENNQLREDLNAMKQFDEEIVGRMSELGNTVDGKADGQAEDPSSMSSRWNHGFEAATKDKRFRFHLGGRVQFDTVFLEEDPAFYAGTGPGGATITDQDAFYFRRARLRADGTMYETIDWCVEFDFVNSINDDPGAPAPGNVPSERNIIGIPAPTDLWLTFREVPLVGNVRVGNCKEPIGLEHLHGSRYLDFLERSFNQDLFYGSFNSGFAPGVLFFDNWSEEHGTWSTGFFKNTSNVFAYGLGDGEYAWTSRVSYLAWYEDDGRYLAHVGLSGSLRDPNNGTQRYRTRGSLRNGPGGLNPLLADTGTFVSSQTDILNFETALQFDSLMVEAEYCITQDHDTPSGDVSMCGWYAQALYFLTSEHREYERKTGVFGRVIPHQNFGECGSLGAWQAGARYSRANLIDGSIDGGELEDMTLGLNWFLNPNLKIQNNYIYTIRDAQLGPGSNNSYGYGMRLAWDF
ncbi:MAG: OprO/OprP family phosphate-selective porin [Planctomycetota bacterium]